LPVSFVDSSILALVEPWNAAMWRLLATILALLSAGVAYFLTVLYKKRRELDGLVSLPFPKLTASDPRLDLRGGGRE